MVPGIGVDNTILASTADAPKSARRYVLEGMIRRRNQELAAAFRNSVVVLPSDYASRNRSVSSLSDLFLFTGTLAVF